MTLVTARDASMRPPDLPGGNVAAKPASETARPASMRPPDLPGGNCKANCRSRRSMSRFNEAAGFTRRKPGSARFA